jgi:hypothetical protein
MEMEMEILHFFSPVYICNVVMYLVIFAYITRANVLFHILFPLMIANAIVGTIILLFYWDNVLAKYMNNTNHVQLELINKLNNMPHTLLALRLCFVILHWLPIIVFLYLGVLDGGAGNILSPISKWLFGMMFMTIYIMVLIKNKMIYENYGYNKKLSYMIVVYPIILFVICLMLNRN